MNSARQPKPPLCHARTTLAYNLRKLRAELSWSQEDLALTADLHRTFVAHVERGARNISLDNIEKLAAALEVPIRRLFDDPESDVEMAQVPGKTTPDSR